MMILCCQLPFPNGHTTEPSTASFRKAERSVVFLFLLVGRGPVGHGGEVIDVRPSFRFHYFRSMSPVSHGIIFGCVCVGRI